jgi:hypothetical protein
MQHSPSWGATSRSASQEIPYLSRNTESYTTAQHSPLMYMRQNTKELTLCSSLPVAHMNPDISPWSHMWASHHRSWSRLQKSLAARWQCWGLCAGWHVLRKEDGGTLQGLTSDVLSQHWACHCTAQQVMVQWASTTSTLHHSASCKNIRHFHIKNQLKWLLMTFLSYMKRNTKLQHKLPYFLRNIVRG